MGHWHPRKQGDGGVGGQVVDLELGAPFGQRVDQPGTDQGVADTKVGAHQQDSLDAFQGRRGRVDDMYQEGDLMVIEGIAPVEEMIGFSSDVRSATEGRASWNTENAGFRVLSDNLQREKIMEIRERKGMKLELSQAIDYI